MKQSSKEELPALIQQLLEEIPLATLGPGKPVVAARQRLEACASAWPKDLDRTTGQACQAGLWLAYDFLDESHDISQNLDSAEGSYWHALMHRREPDASNSKYWFRRVGKHPIFEELAKDAAELGYLGQGMAWDPYVFIDHCEQYRSTGDPAEETLRRVQQAEWRLLFAWCWKGS